MKRLAVAAGVVFYAAVAISNAHAADGQIAFSGAVVAPTCAPGALGNRDLASLPDTRAHCPQDSSSTHYTLQLEPATASRVRLVEYYDDYVRASGTAQTVRVATQTYE